MQYAIALNAQLVDTIHNHQIKKSTLYCWTHEPSMD